MPDSSGSRPPGANATSTTEALSRQLDLLDPPPLPEPPGASRPTRPTPLVSPVPAAAERIERPGLRLRLWQDWLPQPEQALQLLLAEVPWRQEEITLWGQRHRLPRLTCWMADPGCTYRYSGLQQINTPWTPLVSRLRTQVEQAAGCRFNALLLNHYRDGHDRMGWHADDEPELDPEAPIASLSLGASRDFQLRPRRADDEGQRQTLQLPLGNGTLLLMDPPTQQHWQHQLPARRRVQTPRLNLTFRCVRQR
ncbi:MAG: alpha-ketoglutarate-dependent dioxygenase AlkB family protein [Cyanobium sp.]